MSQKMNMQLAFFCVQGPSACSQRGGVLSCHFAAGSQELSLSTLMQMAPTSLLLRIGVHSARNGGPHLTALWFFAEILSTVQ